MRGDATAVADALVPIRDTMAVDGYALDVEEATPDRLSVRIVALEDACEECLVPADVLKMIISGQLGGQYAAEEIAVALPVEH